MNIVLGTTRTPVIITIDPRITDWFISCTKNPTLHLTFKESDFGGYPLVKEYAEKLSMQLGGVFVAPSNEHLFITLSELEERGEFLRINS